MKQECLSVNFGFRHEAVVSPCGPIDRDWKRNGGFGQSKCPSGIHVCLSSWRLSTDPIADTRECPLCRMRHGLQRRRKAVGSRFAAPARSIGLQPAGSGFGRVLRARIERNGRVGRGLVDGVDHRLE